MSKGRVYSITGSGSVSAAVDFIELSAAANKPIELVGFSINQYGVGDVGDAAEELLRWSVVRGNTTSGSGGSAPTPTPINPNDAAAGFTSETGNTTVASLGTAVTLHDDAFNVRAGTTFWWPEGFEPKAVNGVLLCIRSAAPADAITLVWTVYVRELI